MHRGFLAEPNHRYDLTAAASFGDIQYLMVRKPLNPLNVQETMERLVYSLKDNKFDPANDYICLTGQSLTVALLLAVASQSYSTFKVLMYDARTSSYVERVYTTEFLGAAHVQQ